MVVDANGEIINLDASADPPHMLVTCWGWRTAALPWVASFEMEQLSATFKLLPRHAVVRWRTADRSGFGLRL